VRAHLHVLEKLKAGRRREAIIDANADPYDQLHYLETISHGKEYAAEQLRRRLVERERAKIDQQLKQGA
jgi:hypothetical protein